MTIRNADMIYVINEISTEVGVNQLTYILVDYWLSQASHDKGDPPHLSNDFRIRLRPTGTRVVKDDQGRWKRSSDGVFVFFKDLPEEIDLPGGFFEVEAITIDLPAIIAQAIENYWDRATASGITGSNVNPRIKRDINDPHAILSRPDVQAMKGKIVVRNARS